MCIVLMKGLQTTGGSEVEKLIGGGKVQTYEFRVEILLFWLLVRPSRNWGIREKLQVLAIVPKFTEWPKVLV